MSEHETPGQRARRLLEAWSASSRFWGLYDAAPDLARDLIAAEEERDHERKRRESLRVGACDDCGGMGHGPSYCVGPEIVETACPVCGGDGRSAIARERDEARERVAALEAERDRLRAWLDRIEGGDVPCDDATTLRRWAWEAGMGREVSDG